MKRTRMTVTFTRVMTLALALTWGATPARATPTATDMATAEALFDQGKELMRAGNFAEACPKFAESQRLDPGVGTLLGLGDCYERTGRLASAWATFREASALARKAGDSKRDALAQQRYTRLEPTLPKLVVSVKATPGADVTVTDGERELTRAMWGSPIPVDPGEHTIVASALGHEAWTARVQVDKSETKTVEVPPLVASAAGTPAKTPSASPSRAPAHEQPRRVEGERSSGFSPLTLGAFGVGLVGLGVGAGFGLAASKQASDLDAVCKPTCPPERNDELRSANTKAWVSNVGFAVGILGVGLGTYSFFHDRSAKSSRLAPSVTLGARSGQVGLAGAF